MLCGVKRDVPVCATKTRTPSLGFIVGALKLDKTTRAKDKKRRKHSAGQLEGVRKSPRRSSRRFPHIAIVFEAHHCPRRHRSHPAQVARLDQGATLCLLDARDPRPRARAWAARGYESAAPRWAGQPQRTQHPGPVGEPAASATVLGRYVRRGKTRRGVRDQGSL